MGSIFGEITTSPSDGIYLQLYSCVLNFGNKNDNKIAAVAPPLIQAIDLTSDEADIVDLTSDENDVIDLTTDENDVIELTSDDESINLTNGAEERLPKNNLVKQIHRDSDYYLCEFCGMIYLKAEDILHHCDIHRQEDVINLW